MFYKHLLSKHLIILLCFFNSLVCLHAENYEDFIALVRVNNISAVRNIIETHPEYSTLSDDNGDFPLTFAAYNGYYELTKIFVESDSANIEQTNYLNQNSLILASKNNHYDIAKYLLDSKINVNMIDNNKFSAMMYACQNNNLELVKLLFERGSSLAFKTDDGVSAISLVVSLGHSEIVDYFLGKGINLEDTFIYRKNGDSFENFTPLMVAVYHNQLPLATSLLAKGAKVDNLFTIKRSDGDVMGCTALMLASDLDYFDMVKLLLDNKANIKQMASDGTSAVIIAIASGNFKVANYLSTR